MPSALDAFIDDLAAFHQRFGTDTERLVAATETRLATLMCEPGFLPAEACLGSPDRYTQHVLHVALIGATASSRSPGTPGSGRRSTTM